MSEKKYNIVDSDGELLSSKITTLELAAKISELTSDGLIQGEDYEIQECGKKIKKSEKIEKTHSKAWIIRVGIPIVRSYRGNLTLRSLHYRLVAEGMPNNENHYKRVISSMISARWDGLIEFDAFLDHERETHGETEYDPTDPESSAEYAKSRIKDWATFYNKNRWENQEYYPEIFIEKKAIQGLFERPCRDWDVALNPCKGYPSLTFLYQYKLRAEKAIEDGKTPIILYFGDYDCTGEDIPRSIGDTLERMGVSVEVRRIALMEHQVIAWKLPPAPTKSTDTRAANWDGIGQVELDALDAMIPGQTVKLLTKAIEDIFDKDMYDELLELQEKERKEFKEILKRDIGSILD